MKFEIPQEHMHAFLTALSYSTKRIQEIAPQLSIEIHSNNKKPAYEQTSDFVDDCEEMLENIIKQVNETDNVKLLKPSRQITDKTGTKYKGSIIDKIITQIHLGEDSVLHNDLAGDLAHRAVIDKYSEAVFYELDDIELSALHMPFQEKYIEEIKKNGLTNFVYKKSKKEMIEKDSIGSVYKESKHDIIKQI